MPLQRPFHPSTPAIRRWLRADGSLTARLRNHGTVQVRVLRQGRLPLLPAEQRDLHARHGYAREVVLMLQGQPAVWARSATGGRAIQGPWKALRGLGARPLAELLFGGATLARDPLQAARAPRRSPLDQRIRRQWLQTTGTSLAAAPPRWSRSSVFWRGQAPLRVMEAFAPWISALDPDAGANHA